MKEVQQRTRETTSKIDALRGQSELEPGPIRSSQATFTTVQVPNPQADFAHRLAAIEKRIGTLAALVGDVLKSQKNPVPQSQPAPGSFNVGSIAAVERIMDGMEIGNGGGTEGLP